MKRQSLALLLFSVLVPLFAAANMGPEGFYSYQNSVFLETGSFYGDSVQKALNSGFQTIYTLDNDPVCVAYCQKRFAGNPRVHVLLKDSSKDLWEVIASIDEPITFWLDANTAFPKLDLFGVKNTPLMEELDQIKCHPIKTHTLLIDDLHCCDTLYFDYLSLEDIIEKVLEINPAYTISFIDGGDAGEYKNNILVAYIPDAL